MAMHEGLPFMLVKCTVFGCMSEGRPCACCSGPVRYDCVDGEWVYRRDGHEMLERLQSELDAISRQINGDE